MKQTVKKIMDTMDIWAPVAVWIYAVMINIACAYCMAYGIEPKHMEHWPEWLGHPYLASIVCSTMMIILERLFKPFKKEGT